jgi:hypothetical protein
LNNEDKRVVDYSFRTPGRSPGSRSYTRLAAELQAPKYSRLADFPAIAGSPAAQLTEWESTPTRINDVRLQSELNESIAFCGADAG